MKTFESRVYENKDGRYVRTPSVAILHAPDIEVCRSMLMFTDALFAQEFPNGFVFVTTEIPK